MTQPKHAWMVRAGDNNAFAHLVEDAGAVGIGWPELGDLSKLKTRDHIRKHYQQALPDESAKTQQVNADQVFRYLWEIKSGDFVLTYLKSSSEYLIGIVESDVIYDPEPFGAEFPYIRRVKWGKRARRNEFSPEAQASLGGNLTVFGLDNHLKEIAQLHQPAIDEPAPNPQGIFISYRRKDTSETVGRIYDRLVGHFGEDRIFRDLDSIPHGTDFETYIDDQLQQCIAMLVVIGEQWLIKGDNDKPRLHDPDDLVRQEIEAGLNNGLLIIPVLAREATLPPARELPVSLQPLLRLNAARARLDPDFHKDMNELIESLDQALQTYRRRPVRKAIITPSDEPLTDSYQAVYDRLVQAARNRNELVTYKQIIELLGITYRGNAVGAALGKLFDAISQYDLSQDAARPMLTAVAIRTGERTPGGGFYALARNLNLLHSTDPDDEIAFWGDELKKVRAYWQQH